MLHILSVFRSTGSPIIEGPNQSNRFNLDDFEAIFLIKIQQKCNLAPLVVLNMNNIIVRKFLLKNYSRNYDAILKAIFCVKIEKDVILLPRWCLIWKRLLPIFLLETNFTSFDRQLLDREKYKFTSKKCTSVILSQLNQNDHYNCQKWVQLSEKANILKMSTYYT